MGFSPRVRASRALEAPAPLTGEVPRPQPKKECGFVSHEEAHRHLSLVTEQYCEFVESLFEGGCLRPGKVLYEGRLLCVPHARLLKLENHAAALLDRVFRADEWLEDDENLANQEGAEHVRRERDENVEQLRLIRIQVIATREGWGGR
jgi:hypothetical protein